MSLSKLTKEQIAQAVITELEEKEEEISIETKLLDKYSRPKRIMWKSNKEGFYPDIKTSSMEGRVNLYEIELSSKINKAKWRLFSLFARLNHGDFIVVVPETNISYVEAFIVENNFKNTRLVYIPNQQN
jgi:hypothetical protein